MPGRENRRRIGLWEGLVLSGFAVCGALGIAMLVVLWTPEEGPHQTSISYRLFGSAFAIGLTVVGVGMPLAARWRRGACEVLSTIPDEASPPAAAGYACPECGRSLGADQAVSPVGDAQCRTCGRWWNIHRPPRA